MKNIKILKGIFISALVLLIIFVGKDRYIKSQFGSGYSRVSYRSTPSDFQGFFKSIKPNNMQIEMLEIYFDNNNTIIGMDMNFSKRKTGSNLKDRYKSSYNMQGAGLPNLYYTGFFERNEIQEKDIPTIQLWKNATPMIFKTLSTFPTHEFYNVIPKANMYNLGIRDVIDMENNPYKNSWITSNTYVIQKDSINKITSEDNLHGLYAVFMLTLDKPTDIKQQVDHALNSDPYKHHIVYLSLNP